MKIEDMVAAVQKKLGIKVDGNPGPTTWGAIYKAIVGGGAPVAVVPNAIAYVDPRGEKNIATLLPQVQPMARELVHEMLAQFRARIGSGKTIFA
nr:peptidoglycan-binding protein [Rhodoferax sp.]